MKTAVITGGAGVLCSAFAKALAQDGYAVALLDLDGEMAESLAQEIRQNGGRAAGFQADVLDKDKLLAVREEIRAAFGPCDLLINGAGGNHPSCTTAHEVYEKGDEENDQLLTFFNLPKEQFNFVFDLNLLGTLLPSQVFSADMVCRKGCSILNVSSMNAYRPLTKIPAYSAAKAGISNLTQWMAVHLAGAGIRVNALAPGFFVTKQNRDMLFDEQGAPTPRTDKILRATPMGRFGEPEELLGALRFITDEQAAGFITGVILPIDGGFSAYSGV